MQFDTDIASPHKDLFVAVRNTIMSFDDIQETKKEKMSLPRETVGLITERLCRN